MKNHNTSLLHAPVIPLLSDFFRTESAAGIVLMVTALVALISANSPLAPLYDLLLNTPVEVRIGALQIAKPLLLWVNDGLMAVFFLLVGLELKRELIDGELSSLRTALLPAIAAVGGMALPALVYLGINHDNAQVMRGWAIPTATDIAFALGVLSLLGSRVPVGLKVLLTSIAIFDDIGAVAIIAIFYTDHLSFTALAVAASCISVLAVLNWRGVTARSVYLAIGVVMWVALLKSGVHATLSGVILALFIPIRAPDADAPSPLKCLESDLHATVAFMVLPIFAFCNAGVALAGVGVQELLHPVPLGIAMGLVIGKQIGVFGFCWLAIRTGIGALPSGVSWLSLYGLSMLCGIGFTMSLFIGSLAFDGSNFASLFDERLGILVGSLLSGVLGYLVLRIALARDAAAQTR
ncbi:MAG: Na+/H+ antiporter NhaA [Lysobacterales bacterium CG17_big_fil_post_rev_8_21_14_2_50_64_11]|nr:MAG: Na+/H+ antiporter NhaA [Xanthomonadales bacterium CG17_big_fil_post_rev_8_21_14_2_50_64_11]